MARKVSLHLVRARTLTVGLGVVVGAIASLAAQTPVGTSGPFAFFNPIVNLSDRDLRALDAGEAVVRIPPAVSGEAVVFTAIAVKVPPSQFAAWMRHIVELKKNPSVLAVERFSPEPCLTDLRALTLDESDLNEIRRCRAGKCGMKLSAGEIAQLQRAIAAAPQDWKASAQMAFRHVVLQRVQSYVTSGYTAEAAYDDRATRVSLGPTFSGILQRSTNLTRALPRLAEYLERFPRAALPDVESFIYWSKEKFAGKSQISVTHMSLLRPSDPSQPLAIAAGKQVFATHFVDGALSITALLRGPSDGRNYLAYLSRSNVDLLSGFFGGLARKAMSYRINLEAPGILRGLRTRLEAAPPEMAER